VKKKLLVFLYFLAISFAGCKTTDPYAPPPPAPADSFFPETYGSTWKYRDSVYGEPTDVAPIYGVRIDTISFTINGNTTDINSIKCYDATEVSIVYGTTTAYYNVNGHVFALLESSPPYGLLDLQVITDNAPAGYTWLSSPLCTPYGVSPFLANAVQTVNAIKETNINKVVNGKTFTNVVHTAINLQMNVNGFGFKNIANYDIYLAKGIGMIEKDAFVYGDLNSVETIIDYTIGPGPK
jgi:hypothetical protein